jgi:hypothetical protein
MSASRKRSVFNALWNLDNTMASAGSVGFHPLRVRKFQ